MYQPDINTYLEAIRQEFETIKKDNKALKQENARLVDLNNQYFQKMNYYMEMSKKTVVNKASMLKMGSDWTVEGDKIFEVSLGYKLVMEEAISSVAVSQDGKMVAFVSGKEVYTVINDEMFVIDSEMVVYDKQRVKRQRMFNPSYSGSYGGFKHHPTKVSKAVYFSPCSTYLFITESGGFIKQWDLQSRVLVRAIGVPEPRGLVCTEDLLYVISVDRALRIYDKEKVIMVITTMEDLEGPLLLSSDREKAFCFGSGSLICFDLVRRNYTTTGSDKPTHMSLLSDLGFLCVATKSSLNFYKTSPSLRFVSSNENEETNYCTSTFENVLVVGHKKGISYYDIKNKRKMKINIEGGSHHIDSCSTHVVSIENKNTIRIWKHVQ
ncbi:hypothetical protein NGRA_2762 [Nosema granulosis]|uniref:Uncharacterized protein n=1 Tax=Nosema granulosis TaxID=83296 RepID=A0A9P6GWG5_9MICR|nr:hypothetical protein NGRA_2762 [Nosema granulosis]